MTSVWLDGQDHEPALMLRAERLGAPWNGWAAPIASAAQFLDFISRQSWNDPNGTWNPRGVSECGNLTYIDTDSQADELDPEEFPFVGFSDDGVALYSLSGWTWTP